MEKFLSVNYLTANLQTAPVLLNELYVALFLRLSCHGTNEPAAHRVAGVRRYPHTYANKRIRLTFELFAEEHVLDDDFLRFSSREPALPVVTVNYGEELLVNFDRSQRRSRPRCSLGDARLAGNDFSVESSVVDRPKAERLGFPRDTDLGCERQTRFKAQARSRNSQQLFVSLFRAILRRLDVEQTNRALSSRRQPYRGRSRRRFSNFSDARCEMRDATEMRDTSRNADEHITKV